METVKEYIAKQKSIIAEKKKLLNILETSGLDLFVTNNNHGRVEFETRDYSLADNVEIEEYATYGQQYDLIQFTHNLQTVHGNLKIYCRHSEWPLDKNRYAQVIGLEGPYDTERHDVNLLLDFYREKGVKSELINDLKQKVEEHYQKPTPEELDRSYEPDLK